ncbi:SGNH/GDSL hydrolase family protein [Acinetobacter sp. 194]|uniref:SGNH/GDSL hydrolase family protein n=1 Tax=Acinetobacter shaoyimingii TaxID=2715164 RepID=UPI001407D4C0|nr:SGNH/GDSL hydrolase family protein [Acinetobacter shaoyimingii]NHB57475.1 SGNH/GDSL hydrolase family protein [Acinetobacter shaoyimingii]
MWLKISTVALLPALIVQGYKVKKNTPRLPEPEGDRYGQVGQGDAISILIVGDSAAAGVGVSEQQHALSGALLNALRDHFSISWRLHAKTGDDSTKIYHAIQSIEPKQYDVVITSIGVNDVTQLSSAKKWIRKQYAIYDVIQAKFQPKLILASGVPPMHLFPALPNPLAWLFGQYSKQMNQQLKHFIAQHATIRYIPFDIAKYRKLNLDMAEDGFHPSKEIYAVWAQELADIILKHFKDE